MLTHNPTNERVKRQYFSYLREAQRRNEASVDAVAAALSRFESFTRYRDFRQFHHQQAIAFKRQLSTLPSEATREKLAKATQHAVLSHLKRFFHWLAGQSGYKSSLRYSDAEYFNLSEKETRIATARRESLVPTIEQIKHVITVLPASTDMEKRDRALIAFTLLTGARDSAIASLKLKHVDLQGRSVHQDARDVKTKFSKTFTTVFFPVGDDIVRIVADWIVFLRETRLWGNDDPLFPRTKVTVATCGNFEAVSLDRAHWSNAAPIRGIFKRAFIAAGLPYFNPHSFRKTLVTLGQKTCQTPEAFKAWSQNLGHEGVLTTFYSYGSVSISRQTEIIRSMENGGATAASEIEHLLRCLQAPEVLRAVLAQSKS